MAQHPEPTMKLRNGKTTRSAMVLEKPVLTRNPKIYIQLKPKGQVEQKHKTISVSDFTTHLMAIMEELNEWDVKTARIAGISDIYYYILSYGRELRDVPRLAPFFDMVKRKIPMHLGELVDLAFTYAADHEIETIIKESRDNILAVSNMLQ